MMLIAVLSVLVGASALFLSNRVRSLRQQLQDERDWCAYYKDDSEQMELIAEDLQQALREQEELTADFARALGLPVYDEHALHKQLWARAAQGDQLAEQIVSYRFHRESAALLKQAPSE